MFEYRLDRILRALCTCTICTVHRGRGMVGTSPACYSPTAITIYSRYLYCSRNAGQRGVKWRLQWFKGAASEHVI